MQNYLKNDIVWESRKERLALPTSQKLTPVYHSCQGDPKAPPMTLLNQDLLCVNGKVDNNKETGLLGSLTVFIISTIIWERVHDFHLGMESYQQIVNLTALIITFPGIEEYELFTITFESVIGMIYENNKKEKRVMIHKEIHKFCDATLKRVLERRKKYNKDVKYGHVDPSPNDADAEYFRFYEEDIEDRLKHRDQMRRWEMYVNGRPFGSRRDHPE
ncbi:hypothetical protein Tco_0160434 [Tanacetum coccineum]